MYKHQGDRKTWLKATARSQTLKSEIKFTQCERVYNFKGGGSNCSQFTDMLITNTHVNVAILGINLQPLIQDKTSKTTIMCEVSLHFKFENWFKYFGIDL